MPAMTATLTTMIITKPCTTPRMFFPSMAHPLRFQVGDERYNDHICVEAYWRTTRVSRLNRFVRTA